jgi:archaellum component FlaC
MNVQLIQSFVNEMKNEINELDREVTGSTVHIPEALMKIKKLKTNLVHLYNLLKIEQSLEERQKN